MFISLLSISVSCSSDEDSDKLSLTTSDAKGITAVSAVIGGRIIKNDRTVVIACGICWSTSINPTLADSSKSSSVDSVFECTLTGLQVSTTYYARVYATNHLGTTYGNQVEFTTLFSIVDIDGNVYHSVNIGNQIWMVENLKTTKYRDGTPITNITDDMEWTFLSTGAYCDYDNNVNNSTLYGRLYNCYAVNNSKNLAPTGWHVPTREEWDILIEFLGGIEVAGKKLKDIGTTDSFGFSALPAGRRTDFFVGFEDLGSFGYWWSANEYFMSSFTYYCVSLYFEGNGVYFDDDYSGCGLSVRCIKD